VTYPCPTGCGGGPYSTENGAAMHAINKTDADHDSITDKASAYAALEDVQNQEAGDGSERSTESTEGDGTDDGVSTDSTPEFPESPDGPNVLEADPRPRPKCRPTTPTTIPTTIPTTGPSTTRTDRPVPRSSS